MFTRWVIVLALCASAGGVYAQTPADAAGAKGAAGEAQPVAPESREAASIARVRTFDESGKTVFGGTGVFIGESLFLTSLQLVDQAARATVISACCGEFEVEGVVAVNDDADLAVLRVKTEAGKTKWLDIAAAPPKGDEDVYVAMVILDAGVALMGNKAMGVNTWPGYGPMVRVNMRFGGLMGTSPVLNEAREVIGVCVAGGAHETSLASIVTKGLLTPGELIPLKTFASRDVSNRVKARREVMAGVGFDDEDNRDAAAKAYRHAIKLDPEQWRAKWLLGVTLDMSGKTEESIEPLKEAAKACPGFSEPVYSLGLVNLKLGRSETAESYFGDAAKIDPGYGQAHGMRGVALFQLGKTDEAIACIERAIEVDPRDVRHVNNLTVICRKAGKHERIAPAWRAFTKAHPSDAEGWTTLASVLDPEKDADEIMRALRRAVKAAPEDADVRLHLAATLAEQKKYDEALRETAKCLELDPKHRLAKQLKRLIEREQAKKAPEKEDSK